MGGVRKFSLKMSPMKAMLGGAWRVQHTASAAKRVPGEGGQFRGFSHTYDRAQALVWQSLLKSPGGLTKHFFVWRIRRGPDLLKIYTRGSKQCLLARLRPPWPPPRTSEKKTGGVPGSAVGGGIPGLVRAGVRRVRGQGVGACTGEGLSEAQTGQGVAPPETAPELLSRDASGVGKSDADRV